MVGCGGISRTAQPPRDGCDSKGPGVIEHAADRRVGDGLGAGKGSNLTGSINQAQQDVRAACAVLPDEGDKPEARTEAVFGIAGQLPAEDLLLVEQAGSQQRHAEGKGRSGEVKTRDDPRLV